MAHGLKQFLEWRLDTLLASFPTKQSVQRKLCPYQIASLARLCEKGKEGPHSSKKGKKLSFLMVFLT